MAEFDMEIYEIIIQLCTFVVGIWGDRDGESDLKGNQLSVTVKFSLNTQK